MAKIQTESQNLELFFSKFKLLSYKKHQVILLSDDTPSGIFCIKKGFVRQYALSKNGDELTTAIYKPLDIFPLSYAINNKKSPCCFEAMTDVALWRAPKKEFLSLITNNPLVFFKLISRLINRLDAFSERMQYLAFGHAGSKIASIIQILAERFGKREKKGIVIQLPLTHKDLACLIGITRETASIEIKNLENMNVINSKHHKIIVKNLKELSRRSLI